MLNKGGDKPQKLHPLTAAGALLFLAGMGAWAWTGNWRWALSGLLVLLNAALIAAFLIDCKRRTS